MTAQDLFTNSDILIIGGGPSGMALTAALARRGLSVVCVDDRLGQDWVPTYGGWLDDFDALDVPVARDWVPVVHLSQCRSHRLDRRYAQVDGRALRQKLFAAAESAGATFVGGRVASVDCGAVLEDGRRIGARVVVDATGTGRFVRPGPASAFQLAYGVVTRIPGHPFAADEMVFMDWRSDHLTPSERARPSFLYAMPLDADRVFVEETFLATRQAEPDLAPLADRLARRLRTMGLELGAIESVEHCRIPLDAARPVYPQPIVGFGSAAGLVHPISGYMLTRVLRLAPVVADALVEGLRTDAATASELAWSAVISPDSEVSRELSLLGLRTLLDLDDVRVSDFFDAFFSMPARHSRTMLDPSADRWPVMAAMTSMFATAPNRVRGLLLRHSLGSGGRPHLVRALRSVQ